MRYPDEIPDMPTLANRLSYLYQAKAYHEQHIVAPLLRWSASFREFYEAERHKIKLPVIWLHAPRMDHKGAAGMLQDGDGPAYAHTIRLRNIRPANEITSAHELAHCLFYEQGFPGVASENDSIIAAKLNSMAHDLLVHEMLLGYGFKVRQSIRKEIKNSRKELNNFPAVPADPTQRLKWVLMYVSLALEAELLDLQDDFFAWFQRRYPELTPETGEVLAMVHNVGWTTPGQMSALFKGIGYNYGIGG